jgi:hypothetical protein
MTTEERFLRKAMKDKNFVSFIHGKRKLKNIKVLKFENTLIHTNMGHFEINKIQKLVVLKNTY